MPGWDQILSEVQKTDPFHTVRKKYLANLFETTNRNTICYYSSFLSKDGDNELSIIDSDIEGFMNAIKGLDVKLGLDLILHTPGGLATAAESIVKYLRSIFGSDIRVIVPQIAMSAGTMVACAGKEIIMGKQSSLGPIDPQYNGIPAFNIKKVFEEAKHEMATNPSSANYWAVQLSKFNPAIMYDCINAIDLATELVTDWLITGMFADNPDKDRIVLQIVSKLNQNNDSKTHGRHFDKEKCKDFGLIIGDLEDNNDFQDAVLSVHHAYMVFLQNTGALKVIENHNSTAYIVQKNVMPPK